MAAEGGEVETQQKEETKRHTYPLVRVRKLIRIFFCFCFYIQKYLDK
jgi:hypothetical protein